MPPEPETASMQTSDGIRLDATIWRPATTGPHPVLLMRQPYGRAIASTVVYAHPAWYAAKGFIVVIQDVRGRGTSEGDWRLCEAEKQDGCETVAWAAGLPGSNGNVGMYGFSYQGMSQLFAAAAKPPALKAIAPAMAAWNVREDFATEGDAFRLQSGLGWGAQLALETARRKADAALHQSIYAASRAMPLNSEIPARPPISAALGANGHYLDWLTSPKNHPYWSQVSPAHAGAIDLPALHIGGWYDPLLRGTLETHRALSQGTAPQHLIIGPWVHIPWSRHVGERDFGPTAASDIDQIQAEFFAHHLAGAANPNLPPIRLFELNNTWRDFQTLPTAHTEWPLASTGRASMTEADGNFAPSTAADSFVFDPWRPTPSIGGHAGHPAGPIDRTHADARSDVLTFTTEPLTEPLHLAGPVAARLAITADATSFDVHAIISELPSTGGVYELTSGHRRLATPPTSPVTIDMRATCAVLPPGSRLRLSIAAGAFPAFAVNSGTGKPTAEERLLDQRIITLTLQHAGSALLLPLAHSVQ